MPRKRAPHGRRVSRIDHRQYFDNTFREVESKAGQGIVMLVPLTLPIAQGPFSNARCAYTGRDFPGSDQMTSSEKVIVYEKPT